jgi:threonine dehydrogenase-like Zn-dependent dehydrogenase
MVEYLSVRQQFVLKAEGLSLDQAAMIEFLAIGAHAASRGMVRDDHRVLVSGAGPIGIACALFAKIRGAQVTVLDTREDRLRVCRDSLGVQNALLVDASIDERLETLTGGEMFDVVFDATGNASAMQNAFKYIAHGGSYVLVSVVNADLTFSDPEFHKREATLIGSRNATPADFQYVLACMREQKIPTAALHTHGANLLSVPQVLAGWLKPEAGVIKAVVQC